MASFLCYRFGSWFTSVVRLVCEMWSVCLVLHVVNVCFGGLRCGLCFGLFFWYVFGTVWGRFRGSVACWCVLWLVFGCFDRLNV